LPVATYPAYLALDTSGELARRAEEARLGLRECRQCGHRCRGDRTSGVTGVCGAGVEAVVASCGPHFGEEPVLVGEEGSGTVFFSHCNLNCVFCQNYDISHLAEGTPVSDERLAHLFLRIQDLGCHNLNLVTPTHFLAQILNALALAAERGLRIPVVWNCGGFESPEALRLLDGVVDIYMPDAKYQDSGIAERLSGAPTYPEVSRAALREMHRQVGSLLVDPSGLARRGLLVRHLVLPHDLAGTAALARFLAEEISPHTYLNVMPQYRPCFRAKRYQELNRRPTADELSRALEHVRKAGLYRLDRPH